MKRCCSKVVPAAIIYALYSLFFLTDCSGFAFQGVGITSILKLDDGTIIAGTKSGAVFRSTSDISGDFNWTILGDYESKFPVYSLAAEKEGRLFCGGGDRFIVAVGNQDNDSPQRLGPHTGWVKALAFDGNRKILFSIGCNCIEAWNCTDSQISHIGKRSVENSVEASTLSSDLLNLCLVGDNLLASSGVDGRVHVWSTNPKDKEPLAFANLHDGRVTCLRCFRETLFSVGHDGRICALEVSSSGINLKSELEISGRPRLTTCLIIRDSKDKSSCQLGLGSTEGQVYIISVTFQQDAVTMVEEKKLDLPEINKVIYALCSIDESRSLLVGHAQGMHCLSLN